jgi:transcriptional regulator with XRE-family HTH domain
MSNPIAPAANQGPDGGRSRISPASRRADAAVESRRISATLGREARVWRTHRRSTQAWVAAKLGLSRSRYAELERGEGEQAPLDLWVRVGLLIERPLSVSFSRDVDPGPRDAGHLDVQEAIARVAVAAGQDVDIELPMRQLGLDGWADIAIRDEASRTLKVAEIGNRIDDLGAAIRATDRKVAAIDGLGVVLGGEDRPYRVVLGWVLTDTAANRAIVRRYPAVLRARFPGSSVAWAAALTGTGPPPDRPAIAWFERSTGRVRPMRLGA